MNIEITKPEVEAILQRSLRKSGLPTAEDVILVALREFDAKPHEGETSEKRYSNFVDLLLNSPISKADLDLARSRDYPRLVGIE
jgi:hypothetical protein